jgi:hypothetical protein
VDFGVAEVGLAIEVEVAEAAVMEAFLQEVAVSQEVVEVTGADIEAGMLLVDEAMRHTDGLIVLCVQGR